EILSRANIDDLRLMVIPQEKKAGRREIIHMEKFAARISGSPNYNFLRLRLFRLVRLAKQGGQDVRALKIEVVVRSVKIGGYGADEVRPVLARISVAEFDPCDFCQRIGFVRRLKRPT